MGNGVLKVHAEGDGCVNLGTQVFLVEQGRGLDEGQDACGKVEVPFVRWQYVGAFIGPQPILHVDCTVSLLEDKSYDFAFVCGPEIMMKGIYEILEDAEITAEYSLERYMKCALGICGQCCVDNTGWRICVEGPVFKNEKIEEISEFGKYRRNAAGIKQ